MLNNKLLNQLLALTPLEEQQRKTQTFIEDLPQAAFDSKEKSSRTLTNYFFKNQDIYLSKHNRFAAYPNHKHTFFEINYVLQGQAKEVIAGKTVTLNQGDLILLDIGTSHSIQALGENDLLINILFQNNNLSVDLLKELKGQHNVLVNFLLAKASSKPDYIVFSHQANPKISQLLDEIITEYYEQAEFSELVIKSYLNILISQLIRSLSIKPSPKESAQKKLALQLLADIASDYQTVSLTQLAKRYSYNRNYLSNLFKAEIGQTFSAVLTKQRLMQAHKLLTKTNLPVNTIIEQVGISNRSFFYKKYLAYYHVSPKQSRKQASAIFD